MKRKASFVVAPQPQNVSNGVKPTVSKGSTTQHGVIEEFPSFLPEIRYVFLQLSCNGTAASSDVDRQCARYKTH
jgi:hypothetical protein